MFWGVICGIA